MNILARSLLAGFQEVDMILMALSAFAADIRVNSRYPLDRALAAASDGDRFVLQAGEHTSPAALRGVVDVRIRGEKGAVVQCDDVCLRIEDSASIHIEGLTFRGTGGGRVLARGVAGLTLHDVTTREVQLDLEGPAGLKVTGSRLQITGVPCVVGSVQISNNVLVGCGDHRPVSKASTLIHNTLFVQAGPQRDYTDADRYNLFYAGASRQSMGLNLRADAAFIDPAAGDFRLPASTTVTRDPDGVLYGAEPTPVKDPGGYRFTPYSHGALGWSPGGQLLVSLERPTVCEGLPAELVRFDAGSGRTLQTSIAPSTYEGFLRVDWVITAYPHYQTALDRAFAAGVDPKQLGTTRQFAITVDAGDCSESGQVTLRSPKGDTWLRIRDPTKRCAVHSGGATLYSHPDGIHHVMRMPFGPDYVGGGELTAVSSPPRWLAE